ncbi:trypsin-like serine protease [Basidiobolus meristosporus CBS 931.73]|uniref:Trypsin-like serine protease n=1 Tax=Basidiobolus meristosporus CBS 931.73 TaxID=1314790 RepID=A0A1Y1Y913_9FUNG|nr:trypsin-like serine protease [Basidiobolus meristosporus CBS 931.73]|eukprot:ORX94491.1 trypsin-like serine protease [Basidiobolus meristosporus CBS 931.73]
MDCPPFAVARRRRAQSVSHLTYALTSALKLPPINEADGGYLYHPPNQKSHSVAKGPSWEPTLEHAIKAIVSIRANHVRSFDTETSGSYTATGFVVDAERGIILSNRHVVSPAPIIAQAVFTNYEEVNLQPIYRDPVHDFGFFKFDPSAIKFMNLVEIPLTPERAKVGLDIRVVGNDAGEKLSILAGTLARLDRRAPDYGIGEYNDFNTFYLQAASGTSGGSSGSPVLDIEGHAIALNAGGASKASSSYYLPLNRIVAALKYIQQGKPVPRGTFQTEFEHLPYDDIRRLGLNAELEKEIRQIFPDETGLLVVRQVLPKGPGDKILIPGDIVLRLNHKYITNFVDLFAVVDESVGADVELTISRGSKILEVTLHVQDLHSITPNKFVEIGGGIVNELSYQLAKSFSQPVGGVYVATSGHMLASASAWRKSIILSVNHIPTPNLEAFVDAVQTLPDGARVPIRYYSLSKVYKERLMIMNVDRHWHNFRVAKRDELTGLWHYDNMPPPPAIHSYSPATASFPNLEGNMKLAGELLPSFVAIDFHIPYLVDGMKDTQFYGIGLVVDTNRGLIVCDRDTVPISIGDIFLTFANSIIIPGRLLYLHPFFNFAVLEYDPELLGTTPVKAADILYDHPLSQGDEVHMVAISADHNPLVRRTYVTSIGNVATRECSPPRWRAMNVEGIKLDDPVSCQGGVLCNAEGQVLALWINYSSQDDKQKDISFMTGFSVDHLRPVVEPLSNGESPKLRTVDVEFWTLRIAAARTLGLTDEWVQRLESSGANQHTLLYVLSLLSSNSPVSKVLNVGDVVLEMNGKIVNKMGDLAQLNKEEEVEMKILRDGHELTVRVPTVPLDGQGTTRIIGWAGALVQEPYRAVLEQVKSIPQGVYVSCTLYGSPSNTYNLKPGVWISEINDIPVRDLHSFCDAVKLLQNRPRKSADDEYIRLKTISRAGETVRVLSLKTDEHYWPTWQLVQDQSTTAGWRCIFEI